MPARVYSTCQLPGCSNPHYARGRCRGHYVSERSAAVRAASTAINAPTAPAPVPPAPFYATQAQRAEREAAIPVPPVIVPPAPVLPGSCAIPAAPAPVAIDVPAPSPMLPIIPPPPVTFTVTAEDAAAMRRDYGASVPVGSKVYALDQSKGDAGLFAQVEAILSQSKPQSK